MGGGASPRARRASSAIAPLQPPLCVGMFQAITAGGTAGQQVEVGLAVTWPTCLDDGRPGGKLGDEHDPPDHGDTRKEVAKARITP